MRDGIILADLNMPAVALITERFWEQGHFVASAVGMPGVPRVMLPHPLSGATGERMTEAAREAVPVILAALEGGA